MKTHRGRTVAPIEGRAGDIVDRGEQIEELGEQMIGAAELMSRIAEGTAHGRGYSLDKVKEEIGDVHGELRLAGERYKPTGTALKRYGDALDGVQTRLGRIIPECEQTHAALETARGSQETAEGASMSAPPPPPGDAVAVAANEKLAQAASNAQTALNAAITDHDANLAEFDTQYDVWDEAYDKAVNEIGSATDGGISDGFWDDVSGIVDAALTVLTWVGIVLTVLALIVGGPLIALLAAIVAALTLLGTLYLYSQGRKSLGDVGWAVIGVLPFGKLGKLFKGQFKGFGTDFVKQYSGPVTQIRGVRGLPTSASAVGASGTLWYGAVAKNFNSYVGRVSAQPLFGSPSGALSRFFGGANRTWATTFRGAVDGTGPKFSASLVSQLPTSLSGLYSSGGPLARGEAVLNAAKNLNGYYRSYNNTIAPAVGDFFGGPTPSETWRVQLAGTP
ncbi:hypothetical protein [Luethyella okanaganae]|uniref:Uncharacterized protein n=1 Tax=Luethyella okanaganae TaxID=69372 RepID=A0ABW1VFD6_9MICO